MEAAALNPSEEPGARRATRRRLDPPWKLAVVKQALTPGASVAKIARARDLNANQVFRWCRQRERLQAATQPAMMPVTIDAVTPATHTRPITLTVELSRGRLRIEGDVTVDLLGHLVQALSSR